MEPPQSEGPAPALTLDPPVSRWRVFSFSDTLYTLASKPTQGATAMAKTGMEGMMLSLLKGMGIDPEKLKEEFTDRVSQFENNLGLLIAHNAQVNRRLSNIERHLGLESETVIVTNAAIEGSIKDGTEIRETS